MPQPKNLKAGAHRFAGNMILIRFLFISFVAGAALAYCAVGAAESSGNYAADLGRVYGAHQRILAAKEACDTAVPGTRSANEKAYAAWRSQHAALIKDLERRVTAMIRLASQDEKEYSMNLGKYEGAILQERQEYKQILLALDAAELKEQCQRWPGYLSSPDADLGKVYASELETIRKRK